MPSDKALLVIPASNTTVEPEMAALLPGDGAHLVARVHRTGGPLTAAAIPDYADATLAATAPFVHDHPALVIYGCTAAGFLAGAEGNAAIAARLTDQLAAPVITTAGAMLAALHHTGARRVAVLTPYLREVNDGLRRFLAAEGIKVAVLDSLECPTLDALCAVTEAQVLARALQLDTAGCDALFIACSQLPTLGILAPLRRRFGIPVWSSVSATAWHAAHQRVSQAA